MPFTPTPIQSSYTPVYIYGPELPLQHTYYCAPIHTYYCAPVHTYYCAPMHTYYCAPIHT